MRPEDAKLEKYHGIDVLVGPAEGYLGWTSVNGQRICRCAEPPWVHVNDRCPAPLVHFPMERARVRALVYIGLLGTHG